MGVPWARRGKRMDECIDILRGLTSGEFFGYEGEFYSIEPLKQSPPPTEKIPLLVGGNSAAALRRAVRQGDGWTHAAGDGTERDGRLPRQGDLGTAARAPHDSSDVDSHATASDAYSYVGSIP